MGWEQLLEGDPQFTKQRLQEWPDSSGEDDHGRDAGGGFKNTSPGIYESKEKSVIIRKSGKEVEVEHIKNLKGGGLLSYGTTYHPNEQAAAKHVLQKFGIVHKVGTMRK